MYHLELLVAGDGGGPPEVQFIEHRYAKDEYARLVAARHQGLEDLLGRHVKLLCGVLAREVALVILVLCCAVSYPGRVQQPHCVGLCHSYASHIFRE